MFGFLTMILAAAQAQELTVDEEISAAISFVKQAPYSYDIRIISLRAIPIKDRPIRLKTLKFWLNSLSFEPDIVELREVPKTSQLYWFYLSDFGWNAQAWQAVADREPYYTEPLVSSQDANYVRTSILKLEQSKSKHLQLIVRADWLFRETIESDRSAAYYD